MELRFDAILYSKLTNENPDAGHIKCSRGPQVAHPCAKPIKKHKAETPYLDVVLPIFDISERSFCFSFQSLRLPVCCLIHRERVGKTFSR